MDYKVALITGAGSGIGRELALSLSRMGTAIAAVDCAEDGLRKLENDIQSQQGRCATAVLDVTDARRLQDAVADLEKTLGPTDLLIASAGLGLETSGLDYRAEVMNMVMNVNLLGVSNSIAAVLPGMLQRRRGHLVALSSLASYRGLPRMLAYCASKAGVNAMMEGLRVEIEHEGLFTTTICPGWIRTPMTAPVAGRLPRMLEVDDAARRILWAIERKRRFYAFPAAMVWQMRFLNILPRWLRDRYFRKMMRRLNRKSQGSGVRGQGSGDRDPGSAT
jgi:short-subunit dehydrogenase